MSKRFVYLMAFMILIALFTISCSGGTTSTSTGGAKIELGYDYNDEFYIISPRTSFAAGEDFYVSFNNNEPFDSDSITIQADDTETGEQYGEIIFDVDPQWTIMVTEPLSIADPGKYKLKAAINGKVRATQDVIIDGPKESASEAPAVTAGPGEMTTFNESGISFTFPASLAARVMPEVIEEYLDYDEISHPDYLQIVFDKTPVLKLFMIEEYISISEYAASQINDLNKYVSDVNSINGLQELPFLPNPMAGQQFYASAIPISFQNGKGIRYLTQYVQDISPVTNDGLIYTFQGLTNDGQIYISFTMPVSHPDLSADWDDFFNTYEVTYETFSDNYQDYLTLEIDMLHESDDELFTPSLKVLDNIVMSLSIE
jgi:hypothetical protein